MQIDYTKIQDITAPGIKFFAAMYSGRTKDGKDISDTGVSIYGYNWEQVCSDYCEMLETRYGLTNITLSSFYDRADRPRYEHTK